MYRYSPDLNIAASDSEVIVNTVNCVGVMGKGVALAVRERWPSVVEPYQRACQSGRFRPGVIHLHRVEGGPVIVNMATKEHWRDPSRIDWVGSGLLYLSRFLQNEIDSNPGKIHSITLPPPGCGNGGLDWSDVHAMVRTSLAPVIARGIEIRITAPEPDGVDWPFSFAGVGARKTPASVLELMRDAGVRLGGDGFLLRSGGAIGADTAFEDGVVSADGRKEIFLVKPDRKRPDAIIDISDCFPRVARNFHPKPDALSGYAMDLMKRNGAQIFGKDFDRACDVLVCWTPDGAAGGGTGQAIRLARCVGIPVIDLGSPEFSGWDAEGIAGHAQMLARKRRDEIGLPFPGGFSSIVPELQ